MPRRKRSEDELLELRVEQSGYIEANELIDRIKSEGAHPSEVIVWISERDGFDELMYPVDDEISLMQARLLWSEVLALVIHEKGKLLYAAQQIVKTFGGYGQILDVDYNERTKQLVWKVKFSVD